ncbi:Outer membrane protein assembly factor BamB, contains PQQ-like beta-propeller repeat [Cribrihabitans marinus]|uniref:Outer membrane protein assembly factor BamB, contains PQQ-like beta-propeller repeat n=1 Tax=Cribrihabitans marinus TaxID=1227549 RepID=A0A1H6V905_9RHOB|nr:PQQ-like beta-propeller repeat protein [Cribrihabitans marinus]GGH26519.1 pyrrolo-quinoline quinone [Cribrihabitans marinus]SEI98247.1 Outer membrane protein assembly factor BamB, contains PQQ-like beta-propeller repeat [Cribrihabitans marinus]
MVQFSISRAGMTLAGGALLLLSACTEPDVILPGPREDIRPDATAATGAVSNAPAARLPAQVTNASWPQGAGTPAFRTDHPALRSTPQRIWSTQIGEGDSRRQRITAAPVVAGGLIYTLDAGATVTAVSQGGGVVWSTSLVPPGEGDNQATGGGMAYSDGVLYVSSGFGRLTALDARSGTVRWRQRLNATGSGMPTVRDGLVYLVAGDDTGWAIRTSNGRIAWQIQGTPSVGNVLGAPAPALTGDLAVFAFASGDIVASFRKGGLRRWTAAVAGQRKGRAVARIADVTGGPVVVGNRIYVGNHSGRTVAFEADSGDRIWTANEGALTPVWPAGNSVYLISDRNQLIRLASSDGSLIWARELPGFVRDKPRKRGRSYAHYGPLLAGGRIVVASSDGLLRFFDPTGGALVGTVEVPGGATTQPVVAGGTLYVVSTEGELHAFR